MNRMAERGIILTDWNVRAIFDGRKTQTRRLMTPQPYLADGPDLEDRWFWRHGQHVYALPNQGEPNSRLLGIWRAAPYAVGDRLWVKQAWGIHREAPSQDWRETARGWFLFRANGPFSCRVIDRWRSPRFMPKRAARLWLRVMDMRIEPVQDISAEDAVAEGAPLGDCPLTSPHRIQHVLWFADTWDETHGPGAWVRNDWVWVYEFEIAALAAGADDE